MLYTLNHPGDITITSPASGTKTQNAVIAVAGTVQSPHVQTLILDVNGFSRPIQVKNGGFTSEVSLVRGENTIRAFPSGVAANLTGGSDVVHIIAEIPTYDIWTELTWDGPGDVDLHLFLPNGEHCYFERKRTPAGAVLDVDNRQRDGPEHIVMQAAIPGRYTLMVHYYAAVGGPSRAIPWQVQLRLREGEFWHRYSGVLRAVHDRHVVETFTFP